MPGDKHDVLAEDVFSYRAHRDGAVFIFYNGKQVTILRGRAAQTLLHRLERLEGREVQLLLAKVTGNFKHGNERDGKR